MTTHAIATGNRWGNAVAHGAADWICLAAAPTFAVMAALTGAVGPGPHEICAATPGILPLNGMAWMYLLMSAFHVTPWLKLIARRRRDGRRP